MNIYGQTMDKNALRRRVGDMDQVAGIQLLELADGRGRPARAARIYTGSGLDFTLLLDRCMDIGHASFGGKAMGWRSTTGDVAPQYYEADGKRWLRSYFGGLLTTCGLINVGAPSARSAELDSGLHGRIGNTPAKNLSITQEWRGDDYVLEITGTMRETAVFAENLTLTRTVSTKLGDQSICVRDVVTNEGFQSTPFMLLYHCNIGWPAVDAGSELIIPSQHVAPRDATARESKEQWNVFDPPTHRYAEKVYYHDVAPNPDGKATAAILNNRFDDGQGFGVYVRYSPEQLPRFTEWKQMGEQDYVVGLEPCNCGVEGRDVDEQHGLLYTLEPGACHEVEIEFGPVTTTEEVAALRAQCTSKPKMVDSYLDFVKKPR